MSDFAPFVMERWQSIHENRVRYNLSESGVHPLTVAEFAALSGVGDIGDTPIGYGQSNGSDALRANIAALYDGCSDECVVATNGSAEANFIALWQLVRPGDTIAILLPTYMQTYGLARSFGVHVSEVWLREENGWQPDPEEIASAVTEKTRVVVVTNPNNPTGAILNSDAHAAIIAAAQRVGAWILADEVYRGAELNGVETPSFLGQYDRVISTGSLSKAYGLPGLRLGWAVAPREQAHDLWARKDYLTISPGELTDRIGSIALSSEVRPRLLERTRGFLRDGLATLEPWLEEQRIFKYRRPDAGAILYAHYDLPVDSAEMAERLRVDFGVLIVPGIHFEMGPFVRIGFGGQKQHLAEALARFADYLQGARTLLL